MSNDIANMRFSDDSEYLIKGIHLSQIWNVIVRTGDPALIEYGLNRFNKVTKVIDSTAPKAGQVYKVEDGEPNFILEEEK